MSRQPLGIKIYITHNKRVVQLPVNPASISIDRQCMDNKAEILSLGEILIRRGMGLQTIEFDSFFPVHGHEHYVTVPAETYPGIAYYVDFFDGLTTYKDLIDRLQGNDNVVRLTIADAWQPSNSISLKCCVTRFQQHIEGLDMDRHYSVTFTEYRSYGAALLTAGSLVDGWQHLTITTPR